jgi:hypothetical protein
MSRREDSNLQLRRPKRRTLPIELRPEFKLCSLISDMIYSILYIHKSQLVLLLGLEPRLTANLANRDYKSRRATLHYRSNITIGAKEMQSNPKRLQL